MRLASFAALGPLLFLVACADPTAPIEFTQCVRPIGNGSSANYFVDEERRCLGQRWRMPRQLLLTKYVAYEPVAEAFMMRLPPLPVGAADRPQLPKDPDRVTVMPIFVEGTDFVEQNLKELGPRLQPADSIWPGLRARRGTRGTDLDVLVVWSDGPSPSFYARCLFPREFSEQARGRITCDVYSVISRHAVVEYTAPSSRLDQLVAFDRSIVERVSLYSQNP